MFSFQYSPGITREKMLRQAGERSLAQGIRMNFYKEHTDFSKSGQKMSGMNRLDLRRRQKYIESKDT